uniref:probable G-protein coupled receptor 139 n=1 Tax=Pristiophorus japonicus TaxID=55135 RepID=UPI00398F8012
MGYSVIVEVEEIYYPILAAAGFPVNLVAIVILSRRKCGLSKCITRYLVGMAAADLLVVFFDVILLRIKTHYLSLSLLLITPVCCFTNVLRFAAIMVSVWLTVAFTFDRFVAICCEKLKMKYCTDKTAAVVLGVVSVLGCLESVPVYFVYGPREVKNGVPWGCVPKASFYTSPEWTAFEIFHRLLTPCLPFLLVLLLNALTVRRVLATNKVRRRLRGDRSPKDPELENRRRSVVLLFAISGSFVLLWGTQVVSYLHQRIATNYDMVSHPARLVESTGTMLQLLNSCTNTGVYLVTQSRFREELKNVLKYTFTRIIKLVKFK